MGNTSFPQTSHQQYSFFDTYQDPHFGACSIYRHNQHHNEFVLAISRLVSQSDVHVIERNLEFLAYQNIVPAGSSPFLEIVDFRIRNNQGNMGDNLVGSCKMAEVTLYVEFLRHNLRDFLAWRKTEKQPLSVNEVVMALNKAIDAYEMTKNNQIFGPSLNLEDISITIQGEMKFHPLMGKPFFNLQSQSYISGDKSCEFSPLKERIVQKKAFKESKQNFSPTRISSRENRYLSPYLSKDDDFLVQLKKFAQQIILNSDSQPLHEITNPEETDKDVIKFLRDFQSLNRLSEAKKYLGKSQTSRFQVDFAKLKHEESEAKFSKILSQLEEKSQKTDYSYHEVSTNVTTPSKMQSSKSIKFDTPKQYRFS